MSILDVFKTTKRENILRKKFDLNIEKILENWEIYHAIREFIANALDESILTKTKPIQIYEENGIWHIRDFGRGLEYKHFTQNENNEKLANDQVIGRFGIGLKDALATLYRFGITVEIHSKFGTFTIEQSSKQDFSDVFTLHAIIEAPRDPNIVGTDISIKGIKPADIEKAKSLFLIFNNKEIIDKTKYGDIILNNADTKSVIYVNGIQIAEEESFLFSYNITNISSAIKKSLNRERTNVGRSAYSETVKKILLCSENNSVLNLLKEEIIKTNYGNHHDEIKWVEVQEHAIKLLNASNEYVFVSTDELTKHPNSVDEAKRDGKKILHLPENLISKLSNTTDINGNEINTLTNFINNLFDNFDWEYVSYNELMDSEKDVYNKGIQILNLLKLDIGIREIKIVKRLRENMLGLCLAFEILITRDNLVSISQFCSTLIHEAIHAHYDVRDLSREFELYLSHIIGQLSDFLCEKQVNLIKSNIPSPEFAQKEVKTINDYLIDYQYRDNIPFDNLNLGNILKKFRPNFFTHNGSFKRALFFYVITPKIPQDKFHFFQNILSENYEEYLKRREHCKVYSNIKDTLKNMETIFSFPLLSKKEFSVINKPLLCSYEIYKSLKQTAIEFHFKLDYSFLYNSVDFATKPDFYFQFNGKIKELDEIYNECLQIYDSISSKI